MAVDSQAASGPPESGEVIVVLTLRFKPGTSETVLQSVLASVERTRDEAGNDQFDVYRVLGSQDTLVIFERWRSKAVLEEHWGLPYTKEATDLFAEHLAEPLIDGVNVLYLSDMVG